MKKTIRASLGALEIAGSLCGVPFVGAAAIILKDIAEACDDVRVQRVTDMAVHLIMLHSPAGSICQFPEES